MEIQEPYTPEEFKAYYKARWEFLRKPLNFPEGTEIDDFENISLHVMAVDNKKVVGVGRLTYFPTEEGQIRFIGIHEKHKYNIIGGEIMKYLEKEAVIMGLKKIYLNSRENAISFYKNNDFVEVGKPFKGLADIPYIRMEKIISNSGT